MHVQIQNFCDKIDQNQTQKFIKMPKIFSIWQVFENQKVNLIGQKLVENAKIEKFKYDILIDFQQCDSGCFWLEIFGN